ncbi:AAA family ATPase [Streptomyces sp. NPDC091265]|uniref:AAA family ATPase n=1 Tax=unclassified Streptomyces TaxID=2593676 RepID=UPI00344CF58D
MHTERFRDARALLINGTVGVGKTTVAGAVGDRLADAGVSHAVLDLDWLRQLWPAPVGDRFHFTMLLRNLRSIAANYLDAGATRLVLAGVIETDEQRKQLADAVGVGLTVGRLRADPAVIQRRLTSRHEGDPEALRWHVDRCAELDAILVRAGVDDFTVDTSTDCVTDVAASVIRGAGWQ